VAAFLALGAYGIALADDEEAARFEVTVKFNTSVTQDDIDEVGELLRAYDEDLDFVVMEIWPPIGRALLATNVPDFCQTAEAELEAKIYVDDASCGSAAAETPVSPPPVETVTAPVAETPAPAPPVEETPEPVGPPRTPEVITPPDTTPVPIAPAPGTPEVIIAPPPGTPIAMEAPRAGAGSASDGSWPWWPVVVGGAVAAGAVGLLLVYQGWRARPQ
jgi:hypothetical protein